ncbi:phospholipase D-like domain-containing protein [Pseudanabaena mucicola]|uniref:phospholipase D-like domain-containing protein n=1 Tax=Pseudanabaena mucicola TaxID=71190 RepID=UPI0025758DF3|nr:phospholipase D-like domain-containing protein [Pseudanabaena mucicola]
MQVQFIAHNLNFDKVNPFDQAIEQIVNEEGSPVMLTPYFSLSVIQNICSEIHCVLELVTDLEEIRNNIRSENEFELFAQLIKNNQLTLFDIPSLHAKIFVRGTKALIGSANFTNSGLGQNHEASIFIHDAQFTLEVFRWVESLTNGRDSINLEQLRSAYQSALILKRVEANENQAVSKTYLAKSIKVSKSKYGNKKEPKKKPKSALKINTEVVQIVQTVFPRKADLLKALELINILRNVVKDDPFLDRGLSITFISNNRLVLNLGQWKMLAFKYISKRAILEITLCIDFSEYTDLEEQYVWKNDIALESIDFAGKTFREYKFEERWTNGKDLRLIYFPWDSNILIPEKLLEKWHTAILTAKQAFHHWQSSSYMRWHRPELAEFLFSANSESLDLIYPPNQ